jgi:hypothetical protein
MKSLVIMKEGTEGEESGDNYKLISYVIINRNLG